MVKIFGFEIKRADDNNEEKLETFAPQIKDDGAVVVAAGGSFGTYVDLDGAIKTEAELISKYRDMAMIPEIESAISDICNEAIVLEEDQNIVDIDLENLNLPINAKETIVSEFEHILELLEFNQYAYDIFQKFYIDGRLYYHVIIDKDNPDQGIVQVRFLDPRKIRKIREITKKKNIERSILGVDAITKVKKEYYIYNEKGFGRSTTNPMITTTTTGLRIAKEAIVHISSGLTDVAGTLVLGHIHKAIRPMNQLRALEDATIIYRISRAPERRVFYVDVGNLPKMKAEQYVQDLMTKYKNKLVYDAESGEIRDDRKFMCFALDTKIPLLDGRTLPLSKIIEEFNNGKKNWVYSCNPITGKFVPGPISWAGITKQNSEVVKITFDNNESVICTPDHKFPVWNKGLIEAKDLSVGESIIPGYRRMKEITPNGPKYEQIFKNDTQTWEFTHKEVSKWKIENNYNFSIKELKSSDEYKNLSEKRKIRCKSWKVFTPNGNIELIDNLSEYCRINQLNRTNIKNNYGSKGYKAELLRNHKVVSVEFLSEKMNVGCLTIDLEETYHSHHTYLLAAGVYTKNTMLEDFWMPRREGGKGTEIDVLASGQNLGELTDVNYFRTKLYKSLNVPYSRLEPEAAYTLGRSSEITRDEVKFNKFINRLRLRFSTLFLKLLEKQLILKNIIDPDDWKEIVSKIKFTWARDNLYSELKTAEVMNERLNRLQLITPFVGRYYSNEWVRRNVLQQTDEDMLKIDAEIAAEMENPQYNAPMPMSGVPLNNDNNSGAFNDELQFEQPPPGFEPPTNDGEPADDKSKKDEKKKNDKDARINN